MSTKLTTLPPDETGFAEVVGLIAAARQQVFQAVNTALIDLYWQVGQYISRKIEAAEWGAGTVDQLARYIAQSQPGQRGFSRPNLFRMKQFYEAYRKSGRRQGHPCRPPTPPDVPFGIRRFMKQTGSVAAYPATKPAPCGRTRTSDGQGSCERRRRSTTGHARW